MARISTSWTEMYEKVKAHMFERDAESFWYLSTENGREMKTVYTRFENIQALVEWLGYMASQEQAGLGAGGIQTSIAGG